MQLSGRLTGLILSGGSLGGLFLSWLVGQFFEPAGPISMRVILFVDVLLASIVLWLLIAYVRHSGTSTKIGEIK
jgi:nitrate/nitrite transporter NarK